MIDPRIKLTVLHDDNGTFADHSEVACDYTRDTFTASLSSTEDYLYLGYYKPIGAVYIEVTTANTNAGTLAFEYYNGTSWTALTVRDETKGFTRSGFIVWDRPTDQASTSVNSSSKYWVRAKPSVTHSATEIVGINLVFSDDSTLKTEFSEIGNASLLPSGQSSHILSHVSARDEIVKILRQRDYIKYNATTGEENLTQWDLMDIFEVREAAKFKALANVFFDLAESLEDKWYLRFLEYDRKFKDSLKGLRISIDEDDDGAKDTTEKLRPVRITRLRY